MEHLAKKYRGRAEFVIVYCREAHPKKLADAATWSGRARRAEAFAQDVGTCRQVLVDGGGDDGAHRQFGGRPFSTSEIILIDRRGRVAAKLQGPNLDELDGRLSDLAER